jgi:hypothetical protein
MTTDTEDRLTAALRARADLVQPEDLRPAEPPTTAVPLVRRPAAWALAAAAAAAVAAVLVVPSVLGGDDGAPSPAPALPSYPPTPSGEGADWIAMPAPYRGADLDGDGERDPVTQRNATVPPEMDSPWRFEAALSTGGVPSVVVEGIPFRPNIDDALDLDDDGSDEILYYNGDDESAHEIGVLDLEPEGLVDVPIADDPGLTSQVTQTGQVRHWWVDADHLYSYLADEGGSFPGGNGGPGSYFRATGYEWVLEDGALVAVETGTGCVDISKRDGLETCDPARLEGR